MLLDLYPYRASAHSGVWRLMMYFLQEESLKKDEEKKREQEQRQKAAEGEGEGTPASKPMVVHKTRRKSERRVVPREAPAVRQRPVVAPYAPLPELPQTVFSIGLEIQSWLDAFHISRTDFNAAVQAANDEEEEVIELLLLAA